jgi:hypothetical protein
MGPIFVADVRVRKPKLSFFARQFAPDRTPGQLIFDCVFGVIAPILCFIADPIVFRSGFFAAPLLGAPILGQYQLFAYLTSGIAIAALVTWLSFEGHLGAYGAMFWAVFLVGAAFSTVVGIVIFPVSLLGLMFIIGLAGFTPFLTAFVYLRNGIKAVRRAGGMRLEVKTAGGLGAAFILVSLPAIVSYQVSTAVSRSIEELVTGDMQAVSPADRLRWIPYLPSGAFEPIVTAYENERDPQKKEVLKKWYINATGQNIEDRLMMLSD